METDINFDGFSGSQRGEMIESERKERVGSGFTVACPERTLVVEARWMGDGGFSASSVRYLDMRISINVEHNNPGFDPSDLDPDPETGYDSTAEILFSRSPLNGRLDYTLVNQDVTYRGLFVLRPEGSGYGPETDKEIAARAWQYISGDPGTADADAYSNVINSAPSGLAGADDLLKKILTDMGYLSLTVDSSSYTQSTYTSQVTSGTAPLVRIINIEIALENEWTRADCEAQLEYLKSIAPSLDSIPNGRTTYFGYTCSYSRNGAYTATLPKHDYLTYPLFNSADGWEVFQPGSYIGYSAWWPGICAAQPEPATKAHTVGPSYAVNAVCSRVSTLSIPKKTGEDLYNDAIQGRNGLGSSIRYYRMRRYFLDPLAKVMTTNWDGSTSCETVQTPIVLSDGNLGVEIDAQTAVPAVIQKKEITVGSVCP